MNHPMYRIKSVATSNPPLRISQEDAAAFFLTHYAERLTPRSMNILQRILRHPGVKYRHFAFDDPGILIDENPDARADRFTQWSIRLATEAGRKAMERAAAGPDDIGALVVNTCTGFLCPGIGTYVLESLGLPRNIPVFDLVGAGCGGMVPNLSLCGSLVRGSERAALGIAVEICSATFQMGNDVSLIVSNALFGDGSAAAVVRDSPGGIAVTDTVSRYFPEYREDIRYVYRNGQMHNQLSGRLPSLVAPAVAATINDLLSRKGLAVKDIHSWALHNAGSKVLDAIAVSTGISEDELIPTREILAQYGNMSSPSVMFVLERLLEHDISSRGPGIIAAFGAGMSVHASLWEKE